jgi:hypothetical protein
VQLLLDPAAGVGDRGEDVGPVAAGQGPVDPGEHPGGVHVGDRGLGADDHARPALEERGGEGHVPLVRGVGVAGRQRDHRRHPARRNRLVDELLGRQLAGVALVVLELHPPGPAVPGQVQDVHRLLRQRRADLRRGREEHDPDLGTALPGAADRGEDVAQLAFVVQQRTAARQW